MERHVADKAKDKPVKGVVLKLARGGHMPVSLQTKSKILWIEKSSENYATTL